jgi:two-component system cell cycle sensor histidine kinase/response regulator CckA
MIREGSQRLLWRLHLHWRLSLRFKLVASYALLLGSIATFMYLYFPARLGREATEAIAEKAQAIAEMSAYGVAAAMLFDDQRGIDEVFASTRQNPDVDYIVLARGTGDLVSSFALAAAVRAQYNEHGAETGATADGTVYRVTATVQAGGDTLGTLHLGLSLERLHERVQESRRHIAIITILVFLVGVFAVTMISLVVTRPLSHILRVVERVAEGDLTQRVTSRSADEIGYLARAFDSMIEKLGAAYAELQGINRSLEERVAERTLELRREIDERMSAEAALKESEQTFRTMFESAAVGIALVTPDERVLEVNPALEEMLGRGRDDLVGRQVAEAMRNELSAEAIAAFHGLLSGATDRLKGEAELRTRNGVVWAHVVATAVRDAAGGLRFTIAMFENITEQKELAEQLRQSQKLEAVGRLAGGVAHDFNNLLTTINGVADLMLEDMQGAEWLREDLEQIQKAGQRAASLTQQLLAFSRRQMLQPKVLDLNNVVREMAAMLRRMIGEHIRLSLRLDERLDPIRADPGQMAQVIMNLAVNARDAMPLGGELLIETSNQVVNAAVAGRHDTVSGPHVMLVVRDTGHGMDTETKRNIFEPFFTTKEVGKGTGLGLATVYGIVKQSGGGIEVESAPGRGSAFSIVLPSAANAGAAPEIEKAQPRRGGSETLLLVEDEDSVRALVGRVLRKTGYTVIESRHGLEALGIVQSHQSHIDGVVTDVVMPEMSGPQLIERLATVRPGLKVLFMSGYTRDEIDEQGLSTGSFGFIQKPMSPLALASAVRSVLDAPVELRRVG